MSQLQATEPPWRVAVRLRLRFRERQDSVRWRHITDGTACRQSIFMVVNLQGLGCLWSCCIKSRWCRCPYIQLREEKHFQRISLFISFTSFCWPFALASRFGFTKNSVLIVSWFLGSLFWASVVCLYLCAVSQGNICIAFVSESSNQSMKPTSPFADKLSVFATTPCRGLSPSR